MSIHRAGLWLYAAAGCMVVASVAVVLWAGLAPLADPSEDPRGADGSPLPVIRSDSPRALPDLPWFSVIWERDVRRRLFDPPPKPKPETRAKPRKKKKKKSPPPPPLRVKVLATAVGPGGVYAVFQDRRRIRVRREGEKVNGAAVLRIEPGRVTFRHQGREVARSVPRE